jgi:hypothetical protein
MSATINPSARKAPGARPKIIMWLSPNMDPDMKSLTRPVKSKTPQILKPVIKL